MGVDAIGAAACFTERHSRKHKKRSSARGWNFRERRRLYSGTRT